MKNPRLPTGPKRMAPVKWKNWYSSKTWIALRSFQLSRQPLCEMCEALGRVSVADVVDHRTPHKGNWTLFSDPANLQSLDKQCHDSVKQRMEKRGLSGPIGGDVSGVPLDPKHHWNSGPQ